MSILQDEAINYSDLYFFLSQKIKKSAPRCALCFFKKHQKSVPKACLIKREAFGQVKHLDFGTLVSKLLIFKRAFDHFDIIVVHKNSNI